MKFRYFVILLLLGGGLACQPQGRLRVLHAKPPVYPPLARSAAIQGEVLVTVEIGSDGKVIRAQGTTGNPLLRQAAEESVRQWVFRLPTPKREGRVTHTVVFEFKLAGKPSYRSRPQIYYDLPTRVRLVVQPPTVNPTGAR